MRVLMMRLPDCRLGMWLAKNTDAIPTQYRRNTDRHIRPVEDL
jgi:hypothetical protein